QQRLETRHTAIGKADDRLVIDVELAGSQTLAQFAFQRHAVGGRQLLHLAGIDLGGGPTLPLGGNQRQLGILDQGQRLAAFSAVRKPKAAGREYFAILQLEGTAQISASASPMACAARRGSAKRKAKLSPPTRKTCAPSSSPASRSASIRRTVSAPASPRLV